AAAARAASIDVEPSAGSVTVRLDHKETVAAADGRLGDVINVIWGDLYYFRSGPDSIYPSVNGWVHATGQQLVDEAASHPDGTVDLTIYQPGRYAHGFRLVQHWSAPVNPAS
ncbi:hypothetical protein, partial [Nocardia sp. NPDC058497]|uniref:hypothetical protein n=1 Tax=Nocardia sp. NPDC058497 TaxID=3346529 RepID=UPI003652F027